MFSYSMYTAKLHGALSFPLKPNNLSNDIKPTSQVKPKTNLQLSRSRNANHGFFIQLPPMGNGQKIKSSASSDGTSRRVKRAASAVEVACRVRGIPTAWTTLIKRVICIIKR